MARRPRTPHLRWRLGVALGALVLTLGAAPPERVAWAFAPQDALQLPFLAREGAEAHLAQAPRVLGAHQEGRRLLGEGDLLTVDQGADQHLRVGDRYLVLRLEVRGLPHPVAGRPPLGDVLRQAGLVRLTSVGPQRAEAVVERCLDGLEAGDALVPYREPPRLPLRLRGDLPALQGPPERPATVVYLREGRGVAGTGDLLIVDQGDAEGLRVGDVLRLTRPRGAGFSPLGQAVVVRSDAHAATCRVLQALEELRTGDLLAR